MRYIIILVELAAQSKVNQVYLLRVHMPNQYIVKLEVVVDEAELVHQPYSLDEIDGDHKDGLFGEDVARALLEELAEVGTQCIHQYLRLILTLLIRNQLWKACQGLTFVVACLAIFLDSILTLLKCFEKCNFFMVTLNVFLFVYFEHELLLLSFLLDIEHAALGAGLLVTVYNNVFMQIDRNVFLLLHLWLKTSKLYYILKVLYLWNY